MHMKKLVTSLPSTRPEQFIGISTNSSIASILLYSDARNELSKILKLMKSFLKYRVYLLERDIEEIYQSCGGFIDQHLNCGSAKQLWVSLDRDRDDALLEKEQIVFLTKFITALTTRKKLCGDARKYTEFNEIKAVLEWFEEKVVEYSKFVRGKVKEKLVRRADRMKKQHQSNFGHEQNEIIQAMQEQKKQAYLSLSARNKKDRSRLEDELVDKISGSMHKIRPSLGLQKTKDTALLAKLAPYRHDKKRVYECEELQQSLKSTLDLEVSRQQRQIEHIKKVQRNRLLDRQRKHQSVFDQRIRLSEDRVAIDLRNRRSQLQQAQHIKMEKVVKESDRLSNQRINWIRNSLRAYSQREESQKIREIVRNHRDYTQFLNDPEQVVSTIGINSTFAHPLPLKYSTLNAEMTAEMKVQRKRRYEDGGDYETKLMRKIKRQHDLLEEDDPIQIKGRLARSFERNGGGRKSLVDLYDKDLSLV